MAKVKQKQIFVIQWTRKLTFVKKTLTVYQ